MTDLSPMTNGNADIPASVYEKLARLFFPHVQAYFENENASSHQILMAQKMQNHPNESVQTDAAA